MADLFGPEEPESLPSWFTAGKTAPATHVNRVRRGLHPMGFRLGSDETMTCGSCSHLRRVQRNVRVYLKCDLVKDTSGPGTDVRAKWRGCVNWRAQ